MDELLAWLSSNGVTQADLAERLGLTQGAISQWVSKHEVPLRRVREVSDATGIPVQRLRPDFFGEAA
jgi:transcriptional regulator with XRE-family HTH domain